MRDTRLDQGRLAEYAELLGSVELFAGLDRVTRAKLAAHVEPVSVAAGEALVGQDDPADGLYLISRGSFGVFVRGPGAGETRLGTLSRGEPIGEMALLTGEGRSATVRADEDGEALRLDRAHFVQLVKEDPSVALAIATTLCHRLRAANAGRVGATAPEVRDDAAPANVAAIEAASAAMVGTGPVARRRWRPGRVSLGFALAGLALAIGWGTPPPPGLEPAGWHALATLLAIIPLMALNALTDAAIALAIAAVWVIGGVAPARVVLGGYASGSWVLILSVFAIGAAIASCGLLYRLALATVSRARGLTGQVVALAVAGLVIGAAVPNSTARVALVGPAVAEIAEALGYVPKGRAAVGLAMAALVGFGQMAAPFLTSSSTALLAYAVLPEAARAGLDWTTWAIRAAPAHLIMFAGLVAAVLWLHRPTRQGSEPSHATRSAAEALALQQVLLGPPSRQERIAAVVAVALVVGFITQPVHGLEPAWVGVIAFIVLAATGVLTAEALRAVNWNFVLLFGMLIGMADVFARVGLDRWLATVMSGALAGLAATPILFVGSLAVLCFGLSLLLRWQAATPLVIIALAPVADAAGIDPWVVAIVALTACNGFFVPYQSTIYQAFYHGTGGRLFSHAQARPMAFAYAALTLLGLCASVPIWRLMGLL